MSSTFQWAYAGSVNPGVNPGTGKFSLFVPDGYVNPTYIQFSKTDSTSQDADSLLSTLMSKTSFVVAVNSSKYIQLRVSGSADFGTFYRFLVSDSFEIVKVGTFSVDDVVQISDDVPGGGGGGGGGGDPPPEEETEVSWVIVGDFPNKVAYSVNSGRSWTQVSPIVPLSKATCGKKGGDLILIGGEPTATGRSVYSVESFGDAWTPVNLDMQKCNAIGYNGTEWIVVGKGRLTSECVFTSPDGVVWTSQTNVVLEEALNVYWMENSWIVVGKAVVAGSPCMFVNSNSYWIGIDAALIYENLNFDTIKKVIKYGQKLLFIGENAGSPAFGSLEWVSSPTQSGQDYSFSITAIGDLKNNGNYILTFDFQTKKLNVSSDGGETWTAVDSMTAAEVPTTDLIIAEATQDASQTVDMTVINEFFTQYANSIGDNPYDLDSVRGEFTKVKGAIDTFVDLYEEASRLKIEVQDLKAQLETLHDQADDYLEKGLPAELLAINAKKAALRTELTSLETQWGLPIVGSGLTFDQVGKNFEYITADNTYEENLENYTILVNNVPQLVIDENTLAFVNTFLTEINEHLNLTESYKDKLQEYISLLVERDTLYKGSAFETSIVAFNETAETIVEQITEKVERIDAIKTQLAEYVTQIPQMYYDAQEVFDSTNFNLTDVFNTPAYNFGEAYVEEKPWVINLTRLGIVPFEYSLNTEVEGVTTVDIKTTIETDLETLVNAFYERFSGTTFDKDAEDPAFAEINTLYDEALQLQTDSEDERDAIVALYDFETIREERQDEITEYDTYPIQSVATSIPETLDTYIQRDLDKLDELEETYEQFETVIQDREDAIEELYAEQEARAAEREAARVAEEEARQAYLESDEYRAEQEALLQQLQEQQAAQNAIAAQEAAVLLAQQQAAQAELAKQQAEEAAAAAALVAAENEELLRQQEAARIVREEKLRRQAERQAYAAFLVNRNQTFPATRLASARLLYYIFRYFDIETNATNLQSHTLFSRVGLPTLSSQTLELMNGIQTFIRGSFDIYDKQSPVNSQELDTVIANYNADVDTVKRMVMRVLNSYVRQIPTIETYVDDIDISTEIAALKTVDNELGTEIETKYNSLKTTITDELENLETVTSLTLTFSGGVLLTQGTTPLGSVLNSDSEREIFFNGITTNIDFQNMIVAKKINAYLVQLNTFVDSIKVIYDTNVYKNLQKTKLTNSRQVIIDELSDIVTGIFDVDTVDTVFEPVDAAIAGMMPTLNDRVVVTSYSDTTYDETTTTNNLSGTFGFESTNSAFVSKIKKQQQAIKDLANFYTEEGGILNTGTVPRELITFFNTHILSVLTEVRNVIREKMYPIYVSAVPDRTNMVGRFSPFTTDVSLRGINEYIQITDNTRNDTRVRSARQFIDSIRSVAFVGGTYYNKRQQYYSAVINSISAGQIPYPIAVNSQDSGGGLDVSLWIQTVTKYDEINAFVRSSGLDKITEDLQRVSAANINQTLADLEAYRLSVVTPLSSQVYMQTLVSEDAATLLQAYRSNARNLVAALLPTVPVATFPSASDVETFKLQGVTNELRNIVNVLNSYATQTFESSTIPQIQSSIAYFRTTLVGTLPNLISNIQTTLTKITQYKQKVQQYTALVAELQNAIDRKENIVSNYLNGDTPLELEMSDGTPKNFILSIKPTNTNYWEEVSGEDELDYTLFDNQWAYFVGDKVSYNSRVYRVKNATPATPYESDLILSGNPPMFPKTDSSTVFFTANSNFWTYLSPYQEGTSRPSLNQLRSYNGELYKCIQVYPLERTVGIPPADPDFWRPIPTANYVSEGAIRYYDSQRRYVEDEEVLFKFQYRSLENAVAYRLGRFKAVKTTTETFPIRFQRPRLEIQDTLVPERGVLGGNGQVISNTIPYDMVLTGGNLYNQVPRYGTLDDDPWRITGLLRNLRYSVALGPEMAVLYAYTKREEVEDEFVPNGAAVDSPAVQVGLGNNTPDNAATVWNQIVASYTTQYNRLVVNDGPIVNSKSETIEKTIRPIYAKAYTAVCFVLDKYIQDVIFLVNERNIMKQRLYSIYQNYIEDNAAELFLDAELSTPSNFVYRDLGIGEDDSVFTDYYNRYKDAYAEINDKLEFIVDTVNRMLALDIVDNTLTQENYSPIPLGGGVISNSAVLSNAFAVRYHPIGITDWEYITDTTGDYVSQESFFDDDPRFPIMRRVKKLLLELQKKPRYITNTAHLVPSNSPLIAGLFKVALGLAIIANGVAMEIFDISGLPGNSNPLEQVGASRRAMKQFTRTVQNNLIADSAAVRVTDDFLSATVSIRSNIRILQDNIELLEDTARDLIPEPPPINPGTAPTQLANTVPLPTAPSNPVLRDLIADNKRQLEDAKKMLDDAEKALRDLKSTGSTKPALPGKDITEVIERGRTPTKQVTSNIQNQTFIRSGGNISVTGQAGTGFRRFGTEFQGIPPLSPAQVKAEATVVDDATRAAVAQAEDAILKEIETRKAAYTAELTEAERIAVANKEIEIENSSAMKQYEADLGKYSQDLKNAEDANNKARIDFEKADFDYREAVRTSDARAAEIADIRARNARIVAQNEEALATARTALANAREAQRTLVLNRLTELSINATRRSVIITNTLRRLRIVQFVNTVIITRGISAASRAGTLVATSAAGRLANRIASSRGGQLAGRVGGALLGPAVNIGLGFYTAATEGLFDD